MGLGLPQYYGMGMGLPYGLVWDGPTMFLTDVFGTLWFPNFLCGAQFVQPGRSVCPLSRPSRQVEERELVLL